MNIGIDGNEANVAMPVGVSVYTLQLLKYFAEVSSSELTFIVYLRTKPGENMPAETTHFKYRVIRGAFFWSWIFLPFDLFFHRTIDIFFAPAHYIPRFCPVPCVVTIHDLSFLMFGSEFRKRDLYQLTRWTAFSVQKAARLIAVSKTTKKDLMNWYQLPENRIAMIYNGFETDQHMIGSEYAKLGLKTKGYILYLGTIQPRKNITVLIRAFELYKNALRSDLKLVIAGKKGWLTAEIDAAVSRSPYKHDIVLPGYVSDATQADLYRHAFVYVLPSRYEGFGIPLLEAMSYGCPVIASDAASLPEIAGDAALYFHPDSPQDLFQELEELTASPQLYQTLITQGKKRVLQFSWRTCAAQTLEVITQTVQKLKS